MTAVVWANVALAIPFLLAFIGIPLWMTFRRPQTGADHSQARAYLRAKAALASTAATAPGRVTNDTRYTDRIAA
jgi:hypothetical protein